jgi:AcrR family transcriptional regulator
MSKPTPRTQSRRAKRRAAIIEIAAGLAEQGEWTTEALAEAADVSQASLFYYFKGGRSEIETALALHENWLLLDRIEQAVAKAEDGTSALVAIVRCMQEVFEEDPERMFAAFDRMMKGPWPEELIKDHVAKINATYDAPEAKLRDDVEAGRLRPEVKDLRRYIMLVFSLGVGQIVQASMITASGGSSLHASRALFDDLVALVERGTRG